MWLGFAVVGLMVAGLMIFNVGIGGAIVGAVSAIIPAGFYLALFLWLDRYDPEPPGRLIFAFAWGAVIAIFIAYIVNTVFGVIFGGTLAAIISAPIIEEGGKGGCVLIIALFFRKDFDSMVDGIVYAGVVALGFATVENISYYGESMVSGGTGGLFRTLILRGVLSPYSHVLFTCMTGVGIGIARETHDKALKIAAPIIGYCIAVFLHAFWNSLAVLGGPKLFFIGYFLIQAPMFCAFIGLTLYLVHREGRILKQSLSVEVKRGLITHRQLDIAISVFRRTGWVASAIGDGRLFDARRRFLRSVAKLGLCHWHVQRAAEAGSETASFPLITQFQAEVFSLRDKVD
jgi:RsiW-degrading membrane proteinase PrsW (M82 family)